MFGNIRCFIGTACLAAMVAGLIGCTETIMVEAGKYTDYSQNPEEGGNVEMKDIKPLRNPDRGFHVESNFVLQKAGSQYEMYNPYVMTNDGVFTETSPETVYKSRMQSFGNYDRDSLTLVQQYIYLTPWIAEDLDEAALSLTEKILDAHKAMGLQSILRFAYSYDRDHSIASQVTLDNVRKHIGQLSERGVFTRYKGTIATLQAGFFGDWGEWSGADDAKRKGVVDKLLDVFPKEYSIEMRYPADKKRLGFCDNDEVSSRIGYSNDYFTVGTHQMAPSNDYVGADYEQVKAEVARYCLYVAGELPQQEGGTWGLEELLPLTSVLRTLKEHHYSALDVSQNYTLNITSWKTAKVTPAMLRSYEILFDDSYFKDEDGRDVSRSFFSFVRDHLGYRLNLQNTSSVSVENGTLKYDLNITNTGFAQVVNPKDVYLVIISEDGNVVEKIRLDADPKKWVPYSAENSKEAAVYNIKGESSVSFVQGKYKVGIWMPDPNMTDVNVPVYNDSRFNVRFALNGFVEHWWSSDKAYMVNVFDKIEL